MTQEEAFKILKTGASVFLTGAPGSGKTFLLNQYIDYLSSHQIKTAVTATTGIASTHIGGQTIHSWSGIGARSFLSEYELDSLLQKKVLWDRFQKTKVLIIDEISMLEANFFDSLDVLAKNFKRNDLPFGGMQIILVGDFFQLPPVVKGQASFKFAWQSKAWQELKPLCLYLENQYRQDDDTLLRILTNIRNGDDLEYVAELLQERIIENLENEYEATKLFTHNEMVDNFNLQELKKLETSEKFFKMTAKGKKAYTDRLIDSCLSPQVLVLKIGAMVMFTKNHPDMDYVNGTMGKVVDFDKQGFPVVETFSGQRIIVEPKKWSLANDDGKTIAEIEQIPLRLAWAVTIHKSQGMTIELAEIDLSASFTYGQGYVALSRVKSLDGLFLRGLNNMALLVHPQIAELDIILRRQSEKLVDYLNEKTEEELTKKATEFILKSGGVLEKIDYQKNKIQEKSSTLDVTLELIKKNKTILEISKQRDLTIDTIIGHLDKLIGSEKITKVELNYLLPKDSKKIKRVEKIINLFNKLKTESLTEVKKNLPDSFTFDEIKFAKLFKENYNK